MAGSYHVRFFICNTCTVCHNIFRQQQPYPPCRQIPPSPIRHGMFTKHHKKSPQGEGALRGLGLRQPRVKASGC